MAYPEDSKRMEEQWSRRIAVFADTTESVICSVWADEALTGWVLYIPSPSIQNFKDEKCLAVSFAAWMMIKSLADETATPFRIVSKGKNLIAKPYMPHVALKHAVRRGHSDRINILIPVKGFAVV